MLESLRVSINPCIDSNCLIRYLTNEFSQKLPYGDTCGSHFVSTRCNLQSHPWRCDGQYLNSSTLNNSALSNLFISPLSTAILKSNLRVSMPTSYTTVSMPLEEEHQLLHLLIKNTQVSLPSLLALLPIKQGKASPSIIMRKCGNTSGFVYNLNSFGPAIHRCLRHPSLPLEQPCL